MSYVLQSKVGGDSRPHPEGIYSGVCVDVIDRGQVETQFQGQAPRLVNKVQLVFETEQKNEEGRNCIINKTFTASLHPKARLAEFLGKWRGRPVLPGESIDLEKLIGASCTLIISHQKNMVGRTYASIDAISKPTKRVAPSGQYDPALARQRIAEWKAKEMQNAECRVQNGGRNQSSVVSNQPAAAARPFPGGGFGEPPVAAPKSAAPASGAAAETEIDPEVGF